MRDRRDTERYLQSCRSRFWQDVFREEVKYLRNHLDGAVEILSVGCGPAIVESALCELGFRVTGLDVSKEDLDCAPDSIRKVLASAEDMPVPDSSFDAAIYVVSLQFIRDYAKATREASRVLRPGGNLIAMLLNPESAFFKERFSDPDSYVRRTLHTDLAAIQEVIAESFAVRTEYFLGVSGDRLLESANADTAALYVVRGAKRQTQQRKQVQRESG